MKKATKVQVAVETLIRLRNEMNIAKEATLDATVNPFGDFHKEMEKLVAIRSEFVEFMYNAKPSQVYAMWYHEEAILNVMISRCARTFEDTESWEEQIQAAIKAHNR